MNPKNKPRRCLGLGLDSGLDLAISRFTNSLGYDLLMVQVSCFFGTATKRSITQRLRHKT
jgi:hypothetical protein